MMAPVNKNRIAMVAAEGLQDGVVKVTPKTPNARVERPAAAAWRVQTAHQAARTRS